MISIAFYFSPPLGKGGTGGFMYLFCHSRACRGEGLSRSRTDGNPLPQVNCQELLSFRKTLRNLIFMNWHRTARLAEATTSVI